MSIKAIVTGDELVAGQKYKLYRNEQGVKNGATYLATKYNTETEDGTVTQVVNTETGGTFYATRGDIFTQ